MGTRGPGEPRGTSRLRNSECGFRNGRENGEAGDERGQGQEETREGVKRRIGEPGKRGASCPFLCHAREERSMAKEQPVPLCPDKPVLQRQHAVAEQLPQQAPD